MANNNEVGGKYEIASFRKQAFNAFIGWGVSTLLLWLFNRNNDNDSSSSQDPSKYTDSNVNQIGSAVPVALGRVMIKNPLVSYYGDFDYKPYTEEYGMYSRFPWESIITTLVMGILAICSKPDKPVIKLYDSRGGKVSGVITNNESARKRNIMLTTLLTILLTILSWIFQKHMGKTTIQKGFKYYLGWQHILCWTGDNIGIKRIWMNVYDSDVEESTEKGVWDNSNHIAWKKDNPKGIVAHIDDDQMFGGPDEGGGFIGDIRMYLGTEIQGRDSWMVAQMTNSPQVEDSLKGLTPVYPMYVTCVIPKAYIGKQATIPSMWFEVVNYPTRLYSDYIEKGKSKVPVNASKENWTKIGEDSNPAEVIYEILKNDYWGCNYGDDRLDLDSLVTIGNTLVEEKMGVSCLIDQVSNAESFINKILNHVNGVCFDDPKTGKLTFKLIRNDYEENKLSVFNESNCSFMDFTRLDWSETSNVAVASFTDADAKYDTGTLTVSDIANMRITNNYAEKSLDATYFTTEANAKTYAKTQLLSMAYPLAAINFECNRYAYSLTIGQPILVSWKPYGITKQVFRVTDIDYGTLTDGRIRVTAIEDVFGFEKTDYSSNGSISWEDVDDIPDNIARYNFLELPYEMTISLDTYIRAYASRPSAPTVYWSVWRHINSNYEKSSTSSQWSMIGRLNYLLPERYSFDQQGFTVTAIGFDGSDIFKTRMNLINSDPTSYNKTSGQNLLLIDDEIIAFNKIELMLNGEFQIRGVIRGVFDTIPVAHSANSYIYFLHYGQNINGAFPVCYQGSISPEQLEATSATISKEQAFDPTKVTNLTTRRRSESPSIMGNLQFGVDKGTETVYQYNWPATTIFEGDILFKFKSRNKFTDRSIMEQGADSILAETTTKNVIDISCLDVNFELKYDAVGQSEEIIEDMTLKWADFCKRMNYKLQTTNNVILKIKTYNENKGIYSYQEYEKDIIYSMPVVVGIVSSQNEVQTYADSLVTPMLISVPQTSVSPAMTYTYQETCLIFVGDVVTSSSISSLTGDFLKGQDGQNWDITQNVCYRIDGIDQNGKAIIHKIDIDEYYSICNKFTSLSNNTSNYYRYRGSSNGWLYYSPY